MRPPAGGNTAGSPVAAGSVPFPARQPHVGARRSAGQGGGGGGPLGGRRDPPAAGAVRGRTAASAELAVGHRAPAVCEAGPPPLERWRWGTGGCAVPPVHRGAEAFLFLQLPVVGVRGEGDI